MRRRRQQPSSGSDIEDAITAYQARLRDDLPMHLPEAEAVGKRLHVLDVAVPGLDSTGIAATPSIGLAAKPPPPR